MTVLSPYSEQAPEEDGEVLYTILSNIEQDQKIEGTQRWENLRKDRFKGIGIEDGGDENEEKDEAEEWENEVEVSKLQGCCNSVVEVDGDDDDGEVVVVATRLKTMLRSREPEKWKVWITSK